MLVVLILIAGVLLGVTTGLESRLSGETTTPITIARYFPRLSVAAALIVGAAFAHAAALVLLTRWPVLVQPVDGPLPAIYGFVWYQNALLEADAAAKITPVARGSQHLPRALWSGTVQTLYHLFLGAQLGLLLCAIGARGLLEIVTVLVVTLLVANTTIVAPAKRHGSQPDGLLVLRGATGAMLFAVSAGRFVARLSGDEREAVPIAVVTVAILWIAGGAVLRRVRRSGD